MILQLAIFKNENLASSEIRDTESSSNGVAPTIKLRCKQSFMRRSNSSKDILVSMNLVTPG